MTAADYARGTGGTGRKGGGKGKRETDARRPEREEGTRDGKSEREVREDGVRMVCQDIAETGAGNKAETVRCVTSSLAPSREARSTG